MNTLTKRATRRLAASLAIIFALATSSAWAATFWKGTGQDSGDANNWPGAREQGRAHRIDSIYVSKKKVNVLEYATIGLTRKSADEYYSDHFPVMARVEIK